MQPKKVPMRKCVGCGEMFPKRELVRVVKSPDGTLSLDLTGKKSGRGAYVCPRLECFARARKARRFQSSLEVEIPEELLDALEAEIRLAESLPET